MLQLKVTDSIFFDSWKQTLYTRCVLLLVLLLFTNILISTTSYDHMMGSRSIIWMQQIGFVTACLILLPESFKYFYSKKYIIPFIAWGSVLVALWFASMQAFVSEPGLEVPGYNRLLRLYQATVHVMTGVCAYALVRLFIQVNTEGKFTLKFLEHAFILSLLVPLVWMLFHVIARWVSDECSFSPCSHWLRTPPIHANIRHISEQAMFISALASASFIFYKAKTWLLALYFVVASLAYGLLHWSGGRGSLLGLGVAFMFLFVWVLSYDRRLIPRLLILAFGLIFTGAIGERFANVDWLGFSYEVSRIADGASMEELSVNRFDIWTESLKLFVRSPIVGFGGDTFAFHEGLTHGMHPHNSVIQMLLEAGLVGFLGCSAFVLWYLHHVIKRIRSFSVLNIVFFLTLCALMVNSLFGATFFNALPQYYVVLCVALSSLNLQQQGSISKNG